MSACYNNHEELPDSLASFFNEMKQELYSTSKKLSKAYGFDFENDRPIKESKFLWEIYSDAKPNNENLNDF